METKRKKQNELLMESVSSLLSHCPRCQEDFYPEQVHVIREEQRTQLLHATCDHCSSSIVILLLMGGVNVRSIGLATDLMNTEILPCKDRNPISTDDVLEVHALCKNGLAGIL